MKNALFILIAILFTVSANAAIEFAGYLTSGKSVTFALIDTADGRNGFVELGDSFSGYQLVAFVKETEILTLKRDNETLSVKLRAPLFTIPSEVIGREREEQFFQKMREMKASIGPGKKFYLPEDYMATATQFGREIVSREIINGVETIVMDLPEALRSVPDKKGEAQKLNFSLLMTRRDKSKVKLTIR